MKRDVKNDLVLTGGTFNATTVFCILGYQQCNGYKDCKENEDEACGPKCNDCNGWKKLANHELDCGGVSKYTESCSASDTCATRWKQSKNGVLKVWLGCLDQRKCNRLEEKNAPSCKDEPKGVAKGKGCTFCCANSDHCNKSLTKKEVVAV
ncbi:uncharacterized protein [Ptychodera flava]|uniref:uncharacterized protein n=1 Tax=Ptychodera flava TaxID=63121 RepID=UPI00396A744C